MMIRREEATSSYNNNNNRCARTQSSGGGGSGCGRRSTLTRRLSLIPAATLLVLFNSQPVRTQEGSFQTNGVGENNSLNKKRCSVHWKCLRLFLIGPYSWASMVPPRLGDFEPFFFLFIFFCLFVRPVTCKESMSSAHSLKL